MFNIDDIVTYGINGVCKIVDIEEKDIIGTKKFCLVLKPVNNDRTTYYVPVDNEKQLGKLHKILSEEEINKIIDSASKEETLWIDNEKQRKEYYKKIINNSNTCYCNRCFFGNIRKIIFD